MKERDRQILQKIVKYCDEIIATNSHFKSDEKLFKDPENGFIYRNAVSMPILQIGELSKNLSDEFVSQYKRIPWQMMARMRDVLAHHYGSIDMSTSFLTATKDTVEVRNQILAILNEGEQSQD